MLLIESDEQQNEVIENNEQNEVMNNEEVVVKEEGTESLNNALQENDSKEINEKIQEILNPILKIDGVSIPGM